VDRTQGVHRGQHGVAGPDVGADDLVFVIVNRDGVIFIILLLQVPNFDRLVLRARDQLGVVEQNGVDHIVMSLEIVNACTRLEAENVDVVILAS